MKTVSRMGHFLVTIKLKNEVDQCGACHLFMNGAHSAIANTSQWFGWSVRVNDNGLKACKRLTAHFASTKSPMPIRLILAIHVYNQLLVHGLTKHPQCGRKYPKSEMIPLNW